MSMMAFEQLEEYYAAVMELDPSSRSEFLLRLRADRPAIAFAIEQMLSAEAVDIAEQIRRLADARADDPAASENIGPYRLLGKIGEGGFGMVFLAEQLQPVHRVVALKVIKPGMDTKAVLSRFRHELHVLGAMNHPCIPVVFDAGETPDHRPYVVMPLVPGQPITTFCHEQKLTVEQRLHLMMDVCNGIQHAHARGIIHRDLKPENILVSMDDGVPRPGIIDFGLAKALGAPLIGDTAITLDGQLLGTPEYMSPEQARGSLDIDVRTDVYSLGCILYEILTGHPPFTTQEIRGRGQQAMLMILADRQPRPLTRTDQTALDRELDWITHKCLENDPARRYATVEAFAADLKRFRSGQRVEAGPPARLYRLSRWVVRQRVPVAAGLLSLAGLIGGLGLSLAYAAQSQKSAIEAGEVSRITREIFSSVDPVIAQGRDPELLLTMLTKGAHVFESNKLTPRVECDLREMFALAFRSTGVYPPIGEHARRADALIVASEGVDSARRIPMLKCILIAYRHELNPPPNRPSKERTAEELLRVSAVNSPPGSTVLIETKVLVARTFGTDVDDSERLLAEAERIAGPKSETAITMMRLMAKTYADHRRDPRCIEWCVEARRRASEAFGGDHPLVHAGIGIETFVMTVGEVSSHNFAETAAFVEANLPAAERVLGWRHPAIAEARNNYACMLMALDCFDDAVAEFTVALDHEVRMRGERSPMAAWIEGTITAEACWRHRMDVFEQHEANLWRVFPEGPPVEVRSAESMTRNLHIQGDVRRRDRWLRCIEGQDCVRAANLAIDLGISLPGIAE